MPIFTTRGATYPKVMHNVESSLLRQFFDTLQTPIGHTVPEILSAGKIMEEEEEQEQEEEQEYNTILYTTIKETFLNKL